MHTSLTTYTVADYCQAMQRGEIVVNRDYQRSDKIWPPTARSFLIETILLDYSLPKLSLYQVTDLKSKKSFKEIVDGQQRSMAIRDFFEDGFSLSSTLETEEIRGRSYSELPETFQQRFLDYQLSVDLFLSASPEEVREVFRRMNSYTVPLNGEEQRHAIWQGKFKWFIHRLARQFDQAFLTSGLFTPKQLVRMADTKLFAEVCHALFHGIKTTNKRALDGLYRDYDKELKNEEVLGTLLTGTFNAITNWDEIKGTGLMKPYQVYALSLAIIHATIGLPHLQELYPVEPGKLDRKRAIPNLMVLAAALEDPDEPGPIDEFVAASKEKTNSREQRERRFVWMCRALVDDMP